MVMAVLVRYMVIPESQNCPREIRKRFILGKRCTTRAAFGRWVLGNNAVCVDCIVLPFGSDTEMLLEVVGFTLKKNDFACGKEKAA